tara:strand:+ start:3721 stop:3909 length:189 start_codon:yes stop_codon:yes gene_type:complete
VSGLVWAIVAGGVALSIGTFFMARALVKGKSRKAVEEARQRMDSVRDHVPHHTAERLRNNRF